MALVAGSPSPGRSRSGLSVRSGGSQVAPTPWVHLPRAHFRGLFRLLFIFFVLILGIYLGTESD